MATIRGTTGDDSLPGTDDDDSITALDGDDTIDGGDGDDTIFGNVDQDRITGGEGDDFISAGNGSDTVSGGPGNDTIDGMGRNDSITGDAGDDVLISGNGNDTVEGGTGNDTISGGGDNDRLIGGDDSDTLIVDTLGINGVNNTNVDGGSDGEDSDTLDISALIEDGFTVTSFVQNPEDNGNPGFDGQIRLTNPDTRARANINFTDIEDFVICFTPGTRIATPLGERRVEDLRPGDRVFTRDDGIRKLHWAGRRDLGAADLAAAPGLRPVRIRAGALGNDLPERDMLVSPNHRMLIVNAKAQMLLDEREVLVAAKHLTRMDGIDRVEAGAISYLHLLFDRHQVILANGAWSESFCPGDYSLRGLGSAQRHEIVRLFPELDTRADAFSAARRTAKAHEARLLVG